jgi:hypothetical protein
VPAGIAAESLARRIDQFLSSRGYTPAPQTTPKGVTAPVERPVVAPPKVEASTPPSAPTDFVCEEDVRQAVRHGRRIVIGERTIVTPAARDLAEQHRVFVQADWRG